ncbi:DEAD/DEAH box helicase [Lignipirellula cremea]|uniref:Ski2-like helicase n=1 Tax=Lignipirellula cremea TaxID=2528010 RepID=A0A518E170_9BACT|nr:DEAD/DEAH box helicase [Lignipirellula cremea]QDU97822.1 ski2-like helicase [Lignipirellula cremea]
MQPTRDDLAAMYLEQLPYEPYPAQEEALLAWFTSEQGVLLCAPTGTGKTLVAEAALFEALHTDRMAYYTTPLIALTEQKFAEMQAAAVRWGFSADDVGLVTGNRRVNPDARILVVVAEILLNRLLHEEAFDFTDVAAVVMDEFHSFNDYERGIVWEFGLSMLPKHVRTLLLSATVGNARSFCNWLQVRLHRKLELVESTERRVPLTFLYQDDVLLNELIEDIAQGGDDIRKTPALVFCFNREECWNVAEQLKGKSLLHDGQQKRLVEELAHHDWSQGAGPKLKQILMRGVGVHHAGILPKYRRVIEDLFQQKLLSICVCTETLAAGINLPARSVVIPRLLKGPPGKKKLLDPSSAHQMFGRAGRPQFDSEGFVYCLAHEDDVKILRWKEKYDQIPEDTKDPGLIKAKKALKKKQPKRRQNEQYWDQAQFEKLRDAGSRDLASRGPLSWRLLAFMLDASPDVSLLRKLVSNRLMDSKQLEFAEKTLHQMLMTLYRAGYVELEPEPPKAPKTSPGSAETQTPEPQKSQLIPTIDPLTGQKKPPAEVERPPAYQPDFAYPTGSLSKLLLLRSVHPLYGVFLVNQLGAADQKERIQALESVLELPGSVAHFVRVPGVEELPPGPLATTRLDVQLLQLGLASAEELGAGPPPDEEKEDRRGGMFEERVFVLRLGEKLKMLFDHDFPGVSDLRVQSVWAAGEVLEFNDFNSYVTSKKLQKQEGVIFRHLLRMILLVGEFMELCPPDCDFFEWEDALRDIADRLTIICRGVDPESTDKTLEELVKKKDEEEPEKP